MHFSPKLKKSIVIAGIVLFSFAIVAASLIYFFQDRIIKATIEELNTHILTKVEVKDKIEISLFNKFPEISIRFQDVNIFEKATNNPGPLAHAGKIFFSFNFWHFFHGNYTINHLYIEDGFIKIKIDHAGDKNYDIIKQDSTSKGTDVSFNLEKIDIKNLNFIYTNIPAGQNHDIILKEAHAKLESASGKYTIEVKSDLRVNAIAIGRDNYFQNKNLNITSNLLLDSKAENFKVLSSLIKVENALFNVQGQFDFTTKKKVDLVIEEQNGSIQTILSLLPERYYHKFKQYKSTGEIYCSSKIKGNISSREYPHITVNFGCNNASIYHPEMDKKFDKVNFKGFYTNGKNQRASTSVIALSQIHCTMDNRVFEGDIKIVNFNDPVMDCKINGILDAEAISSFYSFKEIKTFKGQIEFNINLVGKISDLKSKETAKNVQAHGEISMKDMMFESYSNPLLFSQINGELLFSNNDLSVSGLRLNIGKSNFQIDGMFKNFISKMLYDQQSLFLDADIFSSFIDADELFYSPTGNNGSSKQNVVENDPPTSVSLKSIDLSLRFNIRQCKYQLFDLRKLKGTINFKNPMLEIQDLACSFIGGEINVNSTTDFHSNRWKSNLNAVVSGVYIDSLLYVFKNFDQKFIQDKNLRGEISGQIQSEFYTDKNLNIDRSGLKVLMDATVVHGELKDFEPMRRLSKFMDEKKLEKIQFSEIKNKILIENEIILIPEMEIKSNISNISISGTHTFDQKMDYRLTVPLENLKMQKKDSDEAFGAIEEDKKGKANVFLTVKGTTDNYKIAYDTDKTRKKIKADIKKESIELKSIFKNKGIKQEKQSEKQSEEFFDFDK